MFALWILSQPCSCHQSVQHLVDLSKQWPQGKRLWCVVNYSHWCGAKRLISYSSDIFFNLLKTISLHKWNNTLQSSRGQWSWSIIAAWRQNKSATAVIWGLWIALRRNFIQNASAVFSMGVSSESEKWLQNETIFSAVSSLFSAYLWKYSNTIIGTFFALMAASPWKRLRSLTPWVLILSTSWLWEMGKIREGKKSSTSPLPPEKCEDACVCYRDYGLGFICIAGPKEISPSKRNH